MLRERERGTTTAATLHRICLARATGLALHWIRLAGAQVEVLLAKVAAEVEVDEVARRGSLL